MSKTAAEPGHRYNLGRQLLDDGGPVDDHIRRSLAIPTY